MCGIVLQVIGAAKWDVIFDINRKEKCNASSQALKAIPDDSGITLSKIISIVTPSKVTNVSIAALTENGNQCYDPTNNIILWRLKRI